MLVSVAPHGIRLVQADSLGSYYNEPVSSLGRPRVTHSVPTHFLISNSRHNRARIGVGVEGVTST